MLVPRIITLLRRALYVFIATALLVVAGLYLLLNTEFGERWLKNFAERQFALLFNGRLSMERVELSFPTSLSLHDVKIFIGQDSVESVSIERLSLTIADIALHRNIEEGFIKELRVGRLSLQTPRTVVVQEPDSAINLLRLLKPDASATSEATDASQTKPIKFLVDEISIRNGDFWWINRLASKPDQATRAAFDSLRAKGVSPVNYDSLHLADVNLVLKGELNDGTIAGAIQELSLEIPEADFSVAEASVSFLISPKRVELSNLALNTSRSSIRGNASLLGYDVFAPLSEDSLKNAKFELNLDIQALSFDDVKRLAPALYFLNGAISAKAIARGTLDSIAIDEFSLAAERSRIEASGEIKHLFELERSELHLALQNSRLAPADAAKLAPSLALPDLKPLGEIALKGGFNGRLDRFRAQLSAQSPVGNATTDIEINLPKKRAPEYAGVLTIERLDLGKALKDSLLSSDLNFTAKLEGKGASLETLEAKFVATMTNSRFGDYRVSNFSANAKFSKKRLEGSLYVAMGEQFAEFAGYIDLAPTLPVYEGAGRVRNFDIATFTKSDSLRSNLTFEYALEGSGARLGDVSVDFSLVLDSSNLGKLRIPRGTSAKATLIQNKSDSSSTFVFHSDLLDIELEGRYNLAQLATLIELESSVVARELYKDNIFRSERQEESFRQVSQKVKSLEKAVKKKVETAKVEFPTLNATFKISLKSLAAMSLVAKTGYFNAKAELRGKINTQPNQCAFTAILKIDSATYSDMFFAQNLNATLGFVDDIEQSEHNLRAKLDLNAFRLKVGNQRLLDAKFETRYDKQAMRISLQTSHVNARATAELDALASVSDGQYVVKIERFKYATNEFSWEANPNSEFLISPQKIRFSNVSFRNKAQELALKGFIEFDGDGTLSLSLKDFDLADLRRSLLPDNFNGPFGGKINLALDVMGNLQRPKIDFELKIQDLIYGSARGGDIALNVTYANKRMEFALAANTDARRKSLVFGQGAVFNRVSGRGKIPINLDSDGTPLGLIETEDVFAEIRSDDIAASALEAFAPLERTSGFVKLIATMRGRFPKPDIRIALTLDNVRTTPIATQVEYALNGEIVATPSDARWTNLTFKDRFGGEGATSGAVRMNNFVVETMDIAIAFNQLSLMRKPEGKDGLPFGVLVASTNNMRYFGTLDAPKLTGLLVINSGDMSSFAKNANNASQFAEAAKFITMRPREDTTLTLEERERLKKERQLSEEFSMDENRSQTRAYQITPYDLMTMDLRVATQRPMLYTIIFNKYLGEQMKVSIEDVNIRVRKRGVNMEAFGSATIAGGSYSAFTKNFEVKQGGKISWNEDDILNANISVMAETRARVDNPDPRRSGTKADVFLVVKITGTAFSPNVAMGYRFEEMEFKMPNSDLPGIEDPNAVLNFALLLSAGKWYAPPAELGGSGGSLGTGMVASAGLSAGVGLLSSQLSRVAGTIAGVQSVNIGLARDASGGFSGVDLAVAYAVPGTDGRLVIIGSGSFANDDSAAARGGNANSQKLEYRVSDKVILEAFRIFGQNSFTIFNQEMQELWGFGVAYRDNFHSWSELSDRIFRRKKTIDWRAREKKKISQQPPPSDSQNATQNGEPESASK
ncbi:MAG: translocation/assembly module TamB domain-containing protein [Chloroherpetonaceae bacterium]|nr:translocation/assembly module TamB domain-containing protein [Chloroherpetonaceae bacterium]MDW8438460.1 translocation/assembly module TamB domain-containing protein [Chloroherpetonaceae bacterium]